MAIVNAVLFNRLVAANGGNTLTLLDSQQALLVNNKVCNLGPITSVSPTATTVTVNEIERYDLLEAGRATTVFNLINAIVATAIASGVALTGLTNWNTSPVLGLYTQAQGSNQTTVDDTPLPVYAENFVFSGTVVGAELRGVTGKPNPVTTKP